MEYKVRHEWVVVLSGEFSNTEAALKQAQKETWVWVDELEVETVQEKLT